MKVKISSFFGGVVKDFTISILDPSTVIRDEARILKKKNFRNNNQKLFDITISDGDYIIQINTGCYQLSKPMVWHINCSS